MSLSDHARVQCTHRHMLKDMVSPNVVGYQSKIIVNKVVDTIRLLNKIRI